MHYNSCTMGTDMKMLMHAVNKMWREASAYVRSDYYRAMSTQTVV